MKTLLLAFGLTFGGIFTSFAQAQIIPLTIDPTQSSVEISIADTPSSSQLSGDVTLDLQAGNAQITGLNLVLDDALNYSLFGGFATAMTSASDVTISLVTPGAPGALAGIAFTQLANSITLGGDLDVIDGIGFAGGSQTFDLSGIAISPVDFNSVNVTQLGGLVTISNSVTITENFNLGAGDIPITIDITYVATGIVPPIVLLGDVNLDGVVNVFDIMPFIGILMTGGFQDEADCNISSNVNFLDIPAFIVIMNNP